MLIAEFIFLIATLYIGSRFDGMGLGVVSGVGLYIEVFVLRMPPTFHQLMECLSSSQL